jgi:hypothetical protein
MSSEALRTVELLTAEVERLRLRVKNLIEDMEIISMGPDAGPKAAALSTQLRRQVERAKESLKRDKEIRGKV